MKLIDISIEYSRLTYCPIKYREFIKFWPLNCGVMCLIVDWLNNWLQLNGENAINWLFDRKIGWISGNNCCQASNTQLNFSSKYLWIFISLHSIIYMFTEQCSVNYWRKSYANEIKDRFFKLNLTYICIMYI